MTAAKLVRVEGRVQGVGFRWSTMAQARALGIAGWARNLPDGSVEVFCQGDEAALVELVSWLGKGPRAAAVRAARASEAEPRPGLEGFEIRG